MINYIIINGTNSNTINGLGINELPPISKPPLRVQTEEIDGRDGDISTNLGYGAYDKTISIGLFGTGYDINEVISFFNGEGTVVFSNEPDKYYKYKIINQIDYEALLKFKSATITFHCQPFKYPLEETPLEIEYEYIEQDNVESATLNNTNGNTHLDISLKGNTSQTGTPTPSTPIPINVVSGDNEVLVCGKNLVEDKIANSSIVSNGYIGNSSNFDMFIAKIKQGETYTITTNDISGGIVAGFFYTKPSVNSTAYNNERFVQTSKTFIAPITGYIAFRTNVDYAYAQCEVGTTATTYEPYQSQTYHITLPNGLELCKIGDYQDYFTKNSGKNLFDKDNATRIYAYISGDNWLYANDSYSIRIPCKHNTQYTISANNSSETIFRAGVTDSENIPTSGGSAISLYSRTSYSNTNIPINVTTGANAKYIIVQVAQNTANATLNTLQIEEGTQATTYEPYGTGQWCKYNAIGKVVLDGSEGWQLWNIDNTNTQRFYRTFNDGKGTSPNTFTNQAYIERFCYDGGDGDFEHYRGSASGSKPDLVIYINRNRLSSVDVAGLKAYFSSNNTQVDYVLETPYLSLIEDETLISQLDNIQNAISYEGQTNVSQVNNDKSFLLDLIAMEKGTDEVVINNIGNVYAKPTIALEGTGETDIYLNNTEILKVDLSEKNKITIDTNNMEAYDPTDNSLANRKVIGNYNSMTLPSGNTTMKITGALTKATITDYSRWL